MEDGTEYIWIKPSDYARGYKLSAAIIDLATCPFDFIKDWIKAICIFAENEDFVIRDSSRLVTDMDGYDLITMIDRLQKISAIYGNIKNLLFFDCEFGNQSIVDLTVDCNGLYFDSH